MLVPLHTNMYVPVFRKGGTFLRFRGDFLTVLSFLKAVTRLQRVPSSLADRLRADAGRRYLPGVWERESGAGGQQGWIRRGRPLLSRPRRVGSGVRGREDVTFMVTFWSCPRASVALRTD